MSGFTPEAEILKSLDPAIADEKHQSSWPTFTLRNAIVTDKTGDIVSLITASGQNELVVSGELVQSKEQIKYYASARKKKALYLEVRPVSHYAFGITEEDEERVWVAGKAGWFILEPAAIYDSVYNGIKESIRLWYAIEDNTKLQSATARDLFIPSMKKKDFRGRTVEDVFRQHADFIIQQMRKDSSTWSKKPIYQHLRNLIKSPKSSLDAQTVSNTMEPRAKTRGRPARAHATELPKTPQRTKKLLQSPIDELHRIETEAAILWKFLERYALKVPQPEKLEFAKIVDVVDNTYIFDDKKQVANYLRFQSKHLLKGMSERRQLKIWGDSSFYQDLMESKLSQSTTGKMAKIVLQVRVHGTTKPAERMGKDGLDVYVSSDEEIPAHHRKSALRPKSGGKGKSYTASHNVEEKDLSPGSASLKKRKVKDGDIMQRRSKRRALSVARSTDKSSPEQDELEQTVEIIDDESHAADRALPLRWKADKANTGLDLDVPVILKGATLDIEPNAPGDVWRCTASGCMRTIYGASGNLGKRLIDEHIYEHEEDEAPPRLGIIMDETKKTNLPVSNLIKRIREFAAAQELAEAVAAIDDKADF